MTIRNRHDTSVPPGWDIIHPHIEVTVYGNDAEKYFSKRSKWLEIDSIQNKDSIRITGCFDGIFSTKRLHVGFIPSDISIQIIQSGILDNIVPILKEDIKYGRAKWFNYSIMLISKKEDKERFNDLLKDNPANELQKEFYRFIKKSNPPKDFTQSDYYNFSLNIKSNRNDIYREWINYKYIIENLAYQIDEEMYGLKIFLNKKEYEYICRRPKNQDVDILIGIGIGRVRDAVNELNSEGILLDDIKSDLMILVDKILDIRVNENSEI